MNLQMNFDLPKDSEEYNDAYNGHKYKQILRDLSNEIREQLRNRELCKDEEETLKHLKHLITYKCEEYNCLIW